MLQADPFCFHDNHGKSIVLTNNRLTAMRVNPNDSHNGIVVSARPMKINHLYEVPLMCMCPRVQQPRQGQF